MSVVCGRKFCTVCGRWRQVCFFRPRVAQNDRVYLQPDCDACHRIQSRESARQRSERAKARALASSKLSHAVARRRRGVPPRGWVRSHLLHWLHAGLVHEWVLTFERWEQLEESGGRLASSPTRLINGAQLSYQDARALRRLTAQTRVSHRWVDGFCTRYELPLWEVESYADVRSMRERGWPWGGPEPRNEHKGLDKKARA